MEILITVVIVTFSLFLLVKSLRKSAKGGCSCSEKECGACPSKNNITLKNKKN